MHSKNSNSIMKKLGTFPQKCEANFTLEASKDKETYQENLVSYYVEANEKVFAYLLIPKEIKTKAPAVIAVHQHANQWHIGKSEVVGLGGNQMYHYGVDLVNKGYVVIAPDLMCFESRIPSHFNSCEDGHRLYEKFMFCKFINEGGCLQTKYLHDLSVAIDVLCSLDYVDKNVLGAIGHSLGGQETAWLMWYDERIKFGIASCGISTMKSIFENNVPHNFALYVPGINAVCDIDTIIADIAPRSFLMTNGDKDKIFPIEGVRQIIDTAKKSYSAAGCSNNFQAIIFKGSHSFDAQVKEKVYDWIEKQVVKLGQAQKI